MLSADAAIVNVIILSIYDWLTVQEWVADHTVKVINWKKTNN